MHYLCHFLSDYYLVVNKVKSLPTCSFLRRTDLATTSPTSSSLASTIRPVGHRFGTLRTTTKSTRFRTASICVSFPTRFVYDFTDILCAYWNAYNWLEYKWFHWYFMRVVQCKWMVSIFHWYVLYKYCKWILCIGADTLIFNVN